MTKGSGPVPLTNGSGPGNPKIYGSGTLFPTPLYLPPHRFQLSDSAEDAVIELRTVAEFELKSEICTCYKVPGRLSPPQGQLSSTTAFYNPTSLALLSGTF
jgi:hypothetical protein